MSTKRDLSPAPRLAAPLSCLAASLSHLAAGRPAAVCLTAVCLAASACQPAPQASEALPQGSEAPEMPSEPWTLEDYQPDTDDGIRVLIIHDMEGLTGQTDPSSFSFGTDLYPSGQEWLAGDINAVVDGLFAGGATEVVIADGHGSGNPDPDLRSDLLDERATQIIREESFDTYFDLPESEEIDAVAVVGMHAKTGSAGFASHTFTLGIDLLINGQSITETELVALSWGRVGVPVIFASGDDRLASDLQTMPWIEFVTVKDAKGADSAVTRPVEEARTDLREGAKRAVERLASAKSMRVSAPIFASLHAVPPASLRFLEGVPGVNYRDDTYTFVTDDMRDAYDGLVAVVGLARVGYTSVLQEVVRSRADGGEIFTAYGDGLRRRWFDQESGRYERPEAGAGLAEGLRRFHGYR